MNATLITQMLRLAREAIDALHENANASRELAAELRRKQTPDA